MIYQIIDNIEMPIKSKTRNRERGTFALTLDSLNVGQGFQFESEASLKNLYPRISPKKFAGKRFQVAEVSAAIAAAEGVTAVAGVYVVKRVE